MVCAAASGLLRTSRLLSILLVACVAHNHSLFGAETPPDLLEEALRICAEFDPQTDPKLCRISFQELVKTCKAALEAKRASRSEPVAGLDAKTTLNVLNQTLLISRQVTYISNKYWRDSLFTSALDKRRGNCLSTSLLYYLVARELRLPVTIAFAPEHAFVRWDDGRTVLNVETTRKGVTLSDEQLMTLYELQEEDRSDTGLLMTLTPAQIRGQLLLNWAAVAKNMEKGELAKQLEERSRGCLDAFPPAALFLEASRKLEEGQDAEAKQIYEKLIAIAKGRYLKTQAVRYYVNQLTGQGKFDEAVDFLKQNTKGAPRALRARVLSQLGELYRHKRDFGKAITCHKLQAVLDPGDNSYNDLGSVLTEAHRDEEAIAAYEKALEYNPEQFFTQVILAGLYERSGAREKGRAYFAQIEEPRENKLTWYGALVWYYANIGKEQEMLQNMDNALRGDPSGHMYQYFVREPDLDGYRQRPAFKKLMQTYKPARLQAAEQPAASEEKVEQAVPEQVGAER